jgi:phytoene dehydrogenase-like protein
MERQIEVFFYGLFMDEDVLREQGFRPAGARQARVDGFVLRLGARATLVPDPGQSVHGMLMRLNHDELDRLYAEPSVAAYRPEPVIATLANGESVAALCFNLPRASEGASSNPDYAAKLTAVARKLGLPESYIRCIV